GTMDFAASNQLQTIRAVIDLSSSPSELPRPSDLEALEQGERYINATILAASQLPLEAGDIFEFRKGSRKPVYYLLLVQACDLTIRSNGARAYAPSSFTLAKIVDKADTYKPNVNEFQLPAHELAGAKKWLLSAASRIQVSPAVLDATVLNPDGKSVIRASMEAPLTATPGFQKRTLKMAQECRKILDKYEADIKLAAAGGQQLPKNLADIIAAGHLAGCRVDGQADSSIDLVTGSISFGIRRVARLNEVTAGLMLRRTAEYHNRPGDRSQLFSSLDPEPQGDAE
ncbi:hypothetical protein, partial [Streptomyces sp. NPDC002082]|uniref:hypothetical protein n=1 Tax=Streptomyces sp. NPDC002082 TaxID=3154772 RepID=UPI0033191ACC